MTLADAAFVFIVIPVDDGVTAIFDTPVSTVVAKHLSGSGLVRCFTGDAVGDLAAAVFGFFVYRDAFNPERLTDTGEVCQ